MPKTKEIIVPKKPKEVELVAMIVELKKLNKQIAGFKPIYAKRDALTEKIMAHAITVDQDFILIQREIKVGKTKVKVNAKLLDGATDTLKAKDWKSTPYPTVTIE